MRTLTTHEAHAVAGGDDSTPPPQTLPTITVTPTKQQILLIASGFSTNQCSFGAFAGAAGAGAASIGTGYAAVTQGLKKVPGAAVGGAAVGLIGQEIQCGRQINNEIHYILRR